MKKIFTLFISIIIVGLANGQVISKERHKSSTQKDTIKKIKTLIVKQDKSPIAKDTVNKNKPLVNTEIVSDTLLVETGKFKLYKKAAHASYYADKFQGQRTTSGKRYDKNKYTAAHKKLPFGTIVKVTNEANGKSVIVEITDRGPFVRTREIDLSRRAFMEIANNKSSGAMKVTIEILQR